MKIESMLKPGEAGESLAGTVASRVLAMLVLLFVPVLCAGCFNRESGEARLVKFESAGLFKNYVVDRMRGERYRYDWNFQETGFDAVLPTGIPDSDIQLPGTGASGPDASGNRPGSGYSSTNIQEEGVDESDVVKNDGEYLYVLSGGTRLSIIRAVPVDDMQVVATVDLNLHAMELYLRGDRLIAVGNDYNADYTFVATVTVLDVQDRSAPSLVAELTTEGSIITSRMIGSKLHMVLSSWPDVSFVDSPVERLLSDVRRVIPDVTVTAPGAGPVSRDIVDWRDIYHPVDPDGYYMTVVATMDVEAPTEPLKTLAVMANVGTVYASTEALYLTDTDYNPWGGLRQTTDVYKISLTAGGPLTAAVGSIPGRLLNRFSLGEHEGYLRAATMLGTFWDEGGNGVYVLGQQEDRLEIIGKVENIAPGEQIYSARFLGDRGFLVTFKKVDPLFTLDLSDPANPRVVGELKVPGYSDYIHPLGENHLLTIGKDAVDMGDFAWYQGVQISVFDVSDFANPQRVDVEIVGVRGTESEALYNPHAFNYFAPAEMLALPMSIYENAGEDPSSYGELAAVGLCLYRVTPEEGIEPLGRIATADLTSEDSWWWYGYSDWTRGIFIEGNVYAVTNGHVRALPLSNLAQAPYDLTIEQLD